LILVSHDRDFLDNIVTSTIVFHGEGIVREYVGGYADYERQSKTEQETRKQTTRPKEEKKQEKPAAQKKGVKLSYKEQRELESLPKDIEAWEEEQEQLQQLSSDPGFYKKEQSEINEKLARLEAIGKELDNAYLRWEELEEKRSGN
jgi:ATP-binding cassette subfamily F protein uup